MSHSGPRRRVDRSSGRAQRGDPVEVTRVEDGTSMGIIRGVYSLHGQRKVLVETVDGTELETADSRVSVLSGQLGRQIRQQVGGDSD